MQELRKNVPTYNAFYNYTANYNSMVSQADMYRVMSLLAYL